MPTDHLTSRFVDRLKAGTAAYEVWDSRLPGFFVRVMPSGVKTWGIRYRAPDGRQRRRSLGKVSVLSATLARERAKGMLEQAAVGKDPVQTEAAAKAQARGVGSYEKVVEDFVEKYCKPRQRSWQLTRAVLLNSGRPWLRRPFWEITVADAYDLVEGYVAAGQPRKAAVFLSWIRTLWRWAANRELVEAPIMDRVDVPIERTVRERRYSDAEIRAVWRATADPAFNAYEAAYIKLCILLAPRKMELARATRAELDDPAKPTLWTVPFERTKSMKRRRPRDYAVPLPPLASRIVQGLPKSNFAPDILFPGRYGDKPLHPGNPLAVTVREKSGVADWTYHPCRDTVASWLQDEGHSKFERGLVLNHVEAGGGATADYSHGFALDLKRQLLEKWADHVAEVVAAGKRVEVLR